MKTSMLFLSALALQLSLPALSEEANPQAKLLALFDKGTLPKASEVRGAWLGRCYDLPLNSTDMTNAKPKGSVFVSASSEGDSGPLFATKGGFKFWNVALDDPHAFDNFAIKDFLNGQRNLPAETWDSGGISGWLSQTDLFTSNCTDEALPYHANNPCITRVAYSADGSWIQPAYKADPKDIIDRGGKDQRDDLLKVRKNGDYLVSVFGWNYIEYASVPHLFHPNWTPERGKKIGQGFRKAQVCYYYKRLD